MPRVTRAALRSVEQQDGSDIAATIPLPQTPIKDRVPLGETTGNKGARSEPASTSEEQAAPAKKATGKGKKGNTMKKANKKTREKAGDVDAGVLEDQSQSLHSSAAEEARQDLLKDGFQGMLRRALALDCTVTNTHQSLQTRAKSFSIMTNHRLRLPLPPTQLADNYHQNLQHQTSTLGCINLMTRLPRRAKTNKKTRFCQKSNHAHL